MKNNPKKNLIISGISLIIALVSMFGMVFAWYSVSKTPSFGNWGAGAMTDVVDQYKDIFKIISPDERENNTLSPGSYFKYSLTLSNNTQSEQSYKILFDSVTATFPAFEDNIDYTKYICDIFESDTDNQPFDPLEGISGDTQRNNVAKNVLESLAQPVSNAINFYYGLDEKEYSDLIDISGNIKDLLDQDENIIGKSMKPFGDLSVTDDDPFYKKFVGTTNKTVCNNKSVADYPTGATLPPEWITIPAGEEKTIFFSLYFDGQITTEGIYEQKNLTLQNSNGFLGQELRIVFSLTIA